MSEISDSVYRQISDNRCYRNTELQKVDGHLFKELSNQTALISEIIRYVLPLTDLLSDSLWKYAMHFYFRSLLLSIGCANPSSERFTSLLNSGTAVFHFLVWNFDRSLNLCPVTRAFCKRCLENLGKVVLYKHVSLLFFCLSFRRFSSLLLGIRLSSCNSLTRSPREMT